MYNIRYHLVSLVAVFFAFALGLMLGSVVAERGYLDTQQSALVEGLQADFADLHDTNDRLESDYERDHAFATQIADAFTDELLDGVSVLVITSEGAGDALSEANAAVIGAGGRAVTFRVSAPGFGLDEASVRAAVMSLGETQTALAERDLAAEISAGLASELTSPAPEATPYVDALRDAGVVEIEGLEPGQGIAGAVMVAAFDGTADPVLVSLMVAMRDRDAAVLGAELSTEDNGVVAACLDAGLSGVDSIDLPQGALSLVMIVDGVAEGHYGLRDGADGTYPALTPGD